MGEQINIQSTGQTWDNNYGPLIVTFWTTVAQINAKQAVLGTTNAAVQTLATAVLGQLNNNVTSVSFAGNSFNIACAAGLASNSWS